MLFYNQWCHVAIVRQDGKLWSVYVNGSLGGSFTTDKNSGYYSSFYLGKYRDYSRYLNGKIDEFRISDIARWTSDFQVPTKPY